jgi:hypothetical protein
VICIEIVTPIKGSNPEEVLISLDQEGLNILLDQLLFLKNGQTDHVHLMSEFWGGSHLEGVPQNSANLVVDHLKVNLVQI